MFAGLTLSFLASGEPQILLSFQFRLGRATVPKIISECCEAIYQVLSEKYLLSLKSLKQQKTIAQQFKGTWNMPHFIGPIDRKHVRIKCPKTLEAYTTTTKNLLALSYQLSATLITALHCSTLVNMTVTAIAASLFTVIWEIIQRSLNQSLQKNVILTSYAICQWWTKYFVLGLGLCDHTQVNQQIRKEFSITCIALYNYLRHTNNPSYCPNSFVDCEDSTEDIKEGDWRKAVTERNSALVSLPNVRGSRYKDDAANIHCCLMMYLNGEGRVDWQLKHVRQA